MKEPSNILAISEHQYKDSSVFGIKGMGEDYKTFYHNVLSKYSRKYDSFDGSSFWHYIHFYDKQDENTFKNEPFVQKFLEQEENYSEQFFNIDDWR